MKALAVVALLGVPGALAAQTAAPRKPAAQTRGSLEILVTSRLGDPLEGITVAVTGPVVRSGRTDANGALSLRNLPAGLYRLRFTNAGWIPLERDVALKGSAATRIEVAMSQAEAPPPPPVSQPPEPVPQPPPPAENVDPKTVFIPDFIDANFLGRAPRKDSVLGCTSTAKTTLLQLREPLAEHTHGNGDEMLYVVAGEATHKVAGREARLEPGSYSLVPRGVAHSITRRGTNPIVLLSIETGQPCGSPDP